MVSKLFNLPENHSKIAEYPYGFHGLVRLTRSIPFDIEKMSLQAFVSKGKFSTSAPLNGSLIYKALSLQVVVQQAILVFSARHSVPKMNKQTLIEQRIYQLHQRVIQKLLDNPERVVGIARANLQRYREQNGNWKAYADWEQKLSLPVNDIIRILDSHDESAVLARSNSPFAGCLSAHERWEILREFRDAHETP